MVENVLGWFWPYMAVPTYAEGEGAEESKEGRGQEGCDVCK